MSDDPVIAKLRRYGLPEEFIGWAGSQGIDRVRRMLEIRIAEQLSGSSRVSQLEQVTQSMIDDLDAEYFRLEAIGQLDQSKDFFRQARLMQAMLFLRTDEVEEALYEYYHAKDAEQAKHLIDDLMSASI